MIADEHIEEFRKLYKEHYGIDLTKAQALEKGLRLIRLIEAVSRGLAEQEATQSLTENYEKQK